MVKWVVMGNCDVLMVFGFLFGLVGYLMSVMINGEMILKVVF